LYKFWLAGLFAVLTAVTTANANGVPLLQFLIDPFHTELQAQDVKDAIPAAIAFWCTLGKSAARLGFVSFFFP
jgi:hypothetical protein